MSQLFQVHLASAGTSLDCLPNLHKRSVDLDACPCRGHPPVFLSPRLPLDDHVVVLRLLCPDLGVFAVSLVTVILCNRLVKNRETVSAANITSVSQLLLGYHSVTARVVLVSGWLMLHADEGTVQKVPLRCSTK